MIYSTQFRKGSVSSSATASSWSYTVPAGHVAVVRSIDVISQVAGALYVGSHVGGGSWFFSTSGVPAFSSKSWDGRQVLNAGETLNALWFSGTHYLWASGYLLTV